MMKIKNSVSKFLVVILLALANTVFAVGPGVPTDDPAPTVPIDMYWFVLAAVAVGIILFTARKFKSQTN